MVPVQGFAPQEFKNVPPDPFDLLLSLFPPMGAARQLGEPVPRVGPRVQGRYFDYHPQVEAQELVSRYHLRLLREMECRGQWVRIYARYSN